MGGAAGGRVKKFRKIFGVGGQKFLFWWMRVCIVGRTGDFVRREITESQYKKYFQNNQLNILQVHQKYSLMFYQEYHIKIFSFSCLYFSSIATVIALSMLYDKHPNKHNNRQFNVKALLKNRFQSIHEFGNAITFKHQSNLLFWYLDNFLQKDKTGSPLQINIARSVFIELII